MDILTNKALGICGYSYTIATSEPNILKQNTSIRLYIRVQMHTHERGHKYIHVLYRANIIDDKNKTLDMESWVCDYHILAQVIGTWKTLKINGAYSFIYEVVLYLAVLR